jgi:RNA polymerase sigma-54 factor
MNLGLNFNLNVGMEQRLSPQMIQSLKLLQMTSMELETVVKQELEANPLLETVEEEVEEEEKKSDERATDDSDENSEEDLPRAEEVVSREEELPERVLSETSDSSNEIDWDSYLEEGFDAGGKHNEETERPDEHFERVPVYAKSLQDHLLDQLHDRDVKPGVEELVEYLIYSLDDRGYLVADTLPNPETGEKVVPPDLEPLHRQIQEVLEGRLALEEADSRIREAVHALQSLEPPGIGARNLRECLLIQIRRSNPVGELARRIIEEDFDLLERLKIAALAKKYEVTPEQIQAAIKEIGVLEPHPGRLLAATTSSTVIPDLIVEEVEGELVLMLNDRTVPSLRISRAYANLLRKGSRATADEKQFVRAKLNSATWLIRAIEQRKSTMLKVMHAIMEAQPDFFKIGPTHLRPLILQDVADKIGMHISTVSRVTNGKYVQTQHGIFELKYFFTASVTQSDGSEVSSVATKDEIKKLIEGEDPRQPLSDQKIVEILKSSGLEVARRTVAKYRDQLEILPARLRKQY